MRLILFCFLLFPILPVWAQTQGSTQQPPTREALQQQQKQLQEEIDNLNATLNAIRKNKKQSLTEVAIIQRKLAVRERLIHKINQEIQRLNDDIYNKQLEINRLKRQLDTLKQNYAKSIVFAYKNRSSYEYLNFLFSARDFNDALKRMAFLRSYRQYREAEAQTILKTSELRQQAIVEMNNAKEQQTKVLETQSNQLKVLEQDKKEKDQIVNQLKNKEKDYLAQLRKTERQRQILNEAIKAAIRREIAEAERRERERLAKAKAEAAKKPAVTANNTPAPKTNSTPANNTPKASDEPITGVVSADRNEARTYSVFETTPEGREMSINFENNKGRLPWPVSGGAVVGQFGTNIVPGTKLKETNDGIFISTKIGAPVRCVADGEVISVMDLGDFQGVLVQHGKYFTVYNKLSDVSVNRGQQVKAGTLIGHAAADFDGEGKIEFRVMNGSNKFVNPEQWLKSR
ncbi:murein hydrolase activator EnvC family protein [Hydrotalea sandarakina]|jgi:septal ring factor EnvC (AmiA/AmiB activator)|uniref:Septal ring factor EnvC (AmiA/AmiB activator) n=1 Tax=Hydrotalea sandarakina TaxID=1004304 RepID=A0A2W7RY95_9BACT|nr:peptidoglycan DD-metalloendopeptidase family protein [Hydrotalea sandarakina]PZX63756.1 septal ring factor EnvC (AmiA/AmiB activator) [Hydrotalea sandarakina]